MLRDALMVLGIWIDVVVGPGEGMSIVCATRDMHMSWLSSPFSTMVDAQWIACIQNSSIPFGDNFQ